jgi:hypothetical protein
MMVKKRLMLYVMIFKIAWLDWWFGAKTEKNVAPKT